MLVINRAALESFVVDGDIVVTVLEVRANGYVKIGIEAPREKLILRTELIEHDE